MATKGKKLDSHDRILKQLGSRIKTLRETKGYTNYEKFAFDHDISRSQFGKYENGYNLTFVSLLKVVDAFDMTLEEFFSEGFDQAKQ